MTTTQVQPLIEALLFASGEPIGAAQLREICDVAETEIDEALRAIAAKYAGPDFGFELVTVAEKYQFRTKNEFGPFIRELKASRPQRLSAAALETLSVVAYKQPVVKSDIEKIRGVDAAPTIKTLLDRGLVRIVGHQPTVGQPALYGTTEEFLKLFGLKSLAELPTLRELNELEREPGESPEPAGEPESAAVGNG